MCSHLNNILNFSSSQKSHNKFLHLYIFFCIAIQVYLKREKKSWRQNVGNKENYLKTGKSQGISLEYFTSSQCFKWMRVITETVLLLIQKSRYFNSL